MKTKMLLWVICLAILFGCQAPPVRVFSVDGYIRPYEQQRDEKLTIVFDPAIAESFSLKEPHIKRMDVYDFRKSLRLSLYYTFASSFSKVEFADEVDSTGTCLVLYRVRPAWEVRSTHTSGVYVEDFGTTNTSNNVGIIVRYDGVVYRQGVKSRVLDQESLSEFSTYARSKLPEVFKDGIKVMCGDIYRDVVQATSYGYHGGEKQP